jgi:hypothetical protein
MSENTTTTLDQCDNCGPLRLAHNRPVPNPQRPSPRRR